VKTHLKKVPRKLNTVSRTHAVAVAMRAGVAK
jgi:DNA-binding CsgD family transcriptional regulator